MPITLNCPKCHKPFRVRDESIGGRVRCPSCGSVLQVPAALSPGSHYGEIPGSVASAGLPPSSAPGSAERPMAEDVTGRRGAPDLDPAGAPPPLPGPPSIKAPPPPSAPPPTRTLERAAATSAIPKAPVGGRTQRAGAMATQRVPLGPAGDDLAWTRVRGGLGLIRWGLFLCSLVFIGAFAHGAWTVLDTDTALSDEPGLLKQPGWPMKKELLVAYTAGPLIPGALLLLFGRLKCGAAPAESHARGLAMSAALFTVLAILGAAVYVALVFFNLGPKTGLPNDILDKAPRIALYATVPAVIVADVLTLLFVGQIGWPLGRPQLQKAVAGFFTYVAVLPAAVLIADVFYPIPPASVWRLEEGLDGESARRVLIWGVILLMAAALFFLRYAGVAGGARRAIRKYLTGGV